MRLDVRFIEDNTSFDSQMTANATTFSSEPDEQDRTFALTMGATEQTFATSFNLTEQGFNPQFNGIGQAGQDGISCTHEWNGTVLTITSASGTSSADLQGPKGDKGDSADLDNILEEVAKHNEGSSAHPDIRDSVSQAIADAKAYTNEKFATVADPQTAVDAHNNNAMAHPSLRRLIDSKVDESYVASELSRARIDLQGYADKAVYTGVSNANAYTEEKVIEMQAQINRQAWQVGAGLQLEDNVLSVDTADEAEQDNTRPITSAAVFAEIGNINTLLATI